MKRMFVALPFSQSIPENLAHDLRTEAGVRWIKPKNLHITLVPPWYTDTAAEVIAKLESVSGSGQLFTLLLDRVCFGPNAREPKYIWAEGQTPSELLDLRIKLHNALNQRMEQRPFRLHLTLARFRPEQFRHFSTRRLNEAVALAQPVSSFVLMESHLQPSGAEYEVVREFAL